MHYMLAVCSKKYSKGKVSQLNILSEVKVRIQLANLIVMLRTKGDVQ